jgi:murein DD-endopeptidase MepM/ murein hydrolase activator NlpD
VPQPGRHAAPRDPARRRTVVLPSVLLAAAGAAFAGMAVVPAAAADAPRVSAAAALAPVQVTVPADANVALMSTLSKGLAAANKPKPKPAVKAPARTPVRASRDRSPATARTEGVTGATFVRPGLGRRTSGFGRRWGRLHAGIDLAAGIGSPVRAVTNATVLSARTEGGYGRCVRLQHADGTVSVYGHLSALLVSAGEHVAAGELIAREGNTGHSTGPHLHFEIRINGVPINPVPWLRARGITV